MSAREHAPRADLQFTALTGLSAHAAAQCLAANNGDARQALASFVQSRRAVPAAAFALASRADDNAAAINVLLGQAYAAVDCVVASARVEVAAAWRALVETRWDLSAAIQRASGADAPPARPLQQHAFNHAPAALRIFRFAADTAPRILELAHVSAFLRECAVEFGSVDATLPGVLRSECAGGRYFKLRAVFHRNAAHCPWLAETLLAWRGGAPVPAAALAPDVTRHDVNWGAEGARRHASLLLSHGGFGLRCGDSEGWARAQGVVGVTSGRHFFQVFVTALADGFIAIGWVDDKIEVTRHDSVGD
jgi:hypothetical protein